METAEQRRADLVPALARMSRSLDYRSTLQAAGVKNSLTIVPALPDDRMSYVFGRLRDAQNHAVVAMPDGDDGYELALFFPASAARVTVAREDDTLQPIHDHCTVSMFFHYLEKSKAKTIVIEQIAARLLVDA